MQLHIPIDDDVKAVVQAFHDHGMEPWMVGGFVRNAIMGYPIGNDMDIHVSNTTGSAVAEIASGHARNSIEIDAKGIVKFHLPSGISIDVSIGPADLSWDAVLRDFTVNAIYWNPLTTEIVDPTSGIVDALVRVLRHIGPSFCNDPLRVLRGMRLAAEYDMHMDRATTALCHTLFERYMVIPMERIRDEWHKWALSRYPSAGIRILVETGWINYYPELSQMQSVPQHPVYHPEGSAFDHTLYVIDECATIARREQLSDPETKILVFAGLLHDTGKITSTFVSADGRITSAGHAADSKAFAREFLDAIHMPQWIAAEVIPLVQEHMVYIPEQANLKQAVQRLARRVAPSSIELLAHLCEADVSGRPPLPKKKRLERERIAAHTLHVEKRPVPSIVRGDDLLARGMKPGPVYAPILSAAYDAQMDGIITDHDDAMIWLDQYLKGLTPQ